MRVGVPTEIWPQEGRVALVPWAVRALTRAGHQVLVQQGAGHASGLPDDEYLRAGAELCPTPEEVWGEAELVWKVQAPSAAELPLLRPGLTLLSFLHLATNPALAQALRGAGVRAFAAELVRDLGGGLPLLTPMSEVAGRLAVSTGAWCLSRSGGGRGVLLGGLPGVDPGEVLILGAGTVGSTAARVALGLGAAVTVMDRDVGRLRELGAANPRGLRTLTADPWNLERALGVADLVIGAVQEPGQRTPVLLRRELLSLLRPGSALVDVSVDQGGCAETTRPTTHADPSYLVDGVVHCAVPNLPGIVPQSATFALVHAALPWGMRLAALGADRAAREDPGLAAAVVG